MYSLRQRVKIVKILKNSKLIKITGVVRGKLETGPYVIFITKISWVSWNTKRYNDVIKLFGLPIRHAKLKWGRFSGDDFEIIADESEIVAL